MNALRLNLFRLHDASHDRPLRGKKPVTIPDLTPRQPEARPAIPAEKDVLRKMTLRIGGMMCEHCECAVKTALEALTFIERAEASHQEGTAVITLSGDLNEDAVREAVRSEDYEYLGIVQDGIVSGAAASGNQKTVRIEGMMCEHCERAVKTALEALPFIDHAEASHEAGTAVITLSGELDEDALRQAIEGEDYGYLGIDAEDAH